jgi:hypothetical protein
MKTRRHKINKAPIRPYRSATAHIVVQGDRITCQGVRGRTRVKRVLDPEGKRVTSVRVTEDVPQIVAKPVGDRKPTAIYVGRCYTGVARSKAYPARGIKQGGSPPPAKPGLFQRAAKAVKRVVVGDDGEGGLAVR